MLGLRVKRSVVPLGSFGPVACRRTAKYIECKPASWHMWVNQDSILNPGSCSLELSKRNTFQDAASAFGFVSFATIQWVVPKSFANLRTLAPWKRNNRNRCRSDELKQRNAGRPILFPARLACAIPAFTRCHSISFQTQPHRPKSET